MRIILVGVMLCAAGCGLVADTGDRVTLSGTPRGIQAFSDMTNGLIRTGKESPEQSSEYFAARNVQEKEVTSRKGFNKSFWEKLVD